MEPRAILHRSRSVDCFPVDGHTLGLRLRTGRGDFDRVEVIYTDNKFTWTQKRRRLRMERALSDSRFDYYTARLHGEDSRFAYIFRLHAGDESWYLCEEGLSRTFRYPLGYFNYFQYPYIHGSEVLRVPEWVRGAVCYQVFPDRFRIGSGKADRSYINLPWGEKPTPGSFAGGDLDGVREGLPYLKELGVSLLYLTPVFRSRSNHKYDVEDYYEVDARFGGNEALRALVKAAHAAGIRVMLDGVFNHCSNENAIFQDVIRRGRRSPYYGWFYVDGDAACVERRNYLTFADVPYMPKLNTENDAVIDYFCQVGAHWVTEYGIDGWRLDVADEIAPRFLRRFREAVKAANPEALIVGEVWHEAHDWLAGDRFDGVMNYGLTKACLDLLAFGTIDARGFADRLVLLLMRCTDPANEMMFNLLDSHDTERFLTRVKGDVRRFRLAMAVAFFLPGIPFLFAGDEIGVMGGYDPDCRRTFEWDRSRWDGELFRLAQRLAALRRTAPLARGTAAVEEENGVVRILRRHGGRRAELLINPGETPRGAFGASVPPMDFLIR